MTLHENEQGRLGDAPDGGAEQGGRCGRIQPGLLGYLAYGFVIPALYLIVLLLLVTVGTISGPAVGHILGFFFAAVVLALAFLHLRVVIPRTRPLKILVRTEHLEFRQRGSEPMIFPRETVGLVMFREYQLAGVRIIDVYDPHGARLELFHTRWFPRYGRLIKGPLKRQGYPWAIKLKSSVSLPGKRVWSSQPAPYWLKHID